ncbi:BlaI/MecI/CopY family transcriptional regulator [Undibacterium squillarum]|uniref:Transcriptional regulator n=1 Tax=Undibacterium squillarum TaxID=1131567 RepID=A0ABQ2XQW1_9BURK|nr:BlaI/MecI/CopY family transcriptional regulator [Undibacterium squillarum]GGX29764.1 hypothetical protein GCM10010946_03400 [Undibacterium squillarum]
MTQTDKDLSPDSAQPVKPTAAELSFLQALFQTGPATAKQLHEFMLRERADLTYANVLRQLQIMHGKGMLSRDESQRSHVYAPVVAQDSLQTSLLKDMIQKVFAGSAKSLVLAALRGHVSNSEREEIAKFLKDDKS